MRIGLIVPGGVDRSARVRVIPVLLALIERLARRHQVLVVAINQEPEACEYDLLGAHVVNLGAPLGHWTISLGKSTHQIALLIEGFRWIV